MKQLAPVIQWGKQAVHLAWIRIIHREVEVVVDSWEVPVIEVLALMEVLAAVAVLVWSGGLALRV